MAVGIAIGDTEVHFWAFTIDPSDIVAMPFRSLLSADEESRASRFRFGHLSNTFTICHGLLRLLLGGYLDADPTSIQFHYQSKGKPVLRSHNGLNFNLSHTNGIMVCGVARHCEMGVDVEVLRPMNDMQELAGKFFCPEEARELLSLPQNQQLSSFYRCWTRKEAYIKAIGEGLSAPLSSFRVTLSPSDTAKLLHIRGDNNLAQSWNLLEIRLGDPYIAAMAYPGPERTTRVHRTMDPLDFLKRDGWYESR